MTKKLEDFLNIDPESLRKAKEDFDQEIDLSNFELLDPQPGETVIGTLTDEEAEITYEWFETNRKYEKLRSDFGANINNRYQKMLKSPNKSDRDRAVLATNKGQACYLLNSQEESDMCRMAMQLPYLQSKLFLKIADRLDHHVFCLGLRSHGRIVAFGKRAYGLI